MRARGSWDDLGINLRLIPRQGSPPHQGRGSSMAQDLEAGAVLWPESWRQGQFRGLRAKEETAGSLELGTGQLCSL